MSYSQETGLRTPNTRVCPVCNTVHDLPLCPSQSHTVTSSPAPMGPFYVFESCREAALGDVQRGGEFALKRDAMKRAADIHQKNGSRTYVLSSAGACVAAYGSRHSSDEEKSL